MTRYTIILLLYLVSLAGCAPSRSPLHLSGDIPLLKKDLLQAVPYGTAIMEAFDTMKGYGFQCSFTTNRSFMEAGPGNSNGSLFTNADFLYCDLEKASFPDIFVSQRWQVCIVHTNGKTAGIYVSYGLTGL